MNTNPDLTPLGLSLSKTVVRRRRPFDKLGANGRI